VTLDKNRKDLTRSERARKLELFYLENLVEDPLDGTDFDEAVLDAMKDLKESFKGQ